MRVVAALLLLSACSAFGEIDYTGKTCPCPAEYSCTTSGKCCQPAIVAENFRVAWTAPNTIRFEWDPVGDAASFGAYELYIGKGADPSASSEVTVIDGEENPQFRYFVLPEIQEFDVRVRSAMVLELEPSTLYWAELRAFDNTGCMWSSPIVQATTAVEPLSDQMPILIFDDTLGPWGTGPLGVDLLVQDPSRASCDSNNFLQWTSSFTGEDTNLQIYDLAMPLAPAGVHIAESAFIQYDIARNQDSFWARVLLGVEEPGNPEGRSARLEAMALRGDDVYRTVQVPLRALGRDDGGAVFSQSDILHRFLVGVSPWEAGTTMRVDCVLIRW